MEVRLTHQADENLFFWKETNNQKILKKIRQLLDAIKVSPYQGIGKPEPLKHSLSGLWSRRITKEHRLVYEVLDGFVRVHSLKGHYK